MAARRKVRKPRKSAARVRAARAAWSRRRAEVRAGAASFAASHGSGHQLAQAPAWARRNPRRPSSSVKELPIYVARRRDIAGRYYWATAAADGTYQGRYPTAKAAIKKARSFARYQRKHAGRHSSVYLEKGPAGGFGYRRITNPRRRFVAVDPKTGAHLRRATLSEAKRYVRQPGRPAFKQPVRVGEVLIDLDTGPGGSHTPGRFLKNGRRKRRGNPMAKKKRTPAQKAAFRRMIAGLKAHKARKNPGRKKRRRGRARRRKTTTVVVSTNPRRKRRKNSRGGSIMAKRRRRSRTNPGRRHHRRRNPHRRHHRRRNPGGGGMVSIVKSTIAAAIPSMAAGGGLALIDSKLFKDKAMPVQVIGKLGLAAGAGYLLRGRPRTAALVMGAIMGGLGYQLVAQAAGGVVAPDKPAAAKAMAALVYADRRMAALVNSNGTLRTQPTLSGMGQSMGDGGTALPTMPIYDPVNLG